LVLVHLMLRLAPQPLRLGLALNRNLLLGLLYQLLVLLVLVLLVVVVVLLLVALLVALLLVALVVVLLVLMLVLLYSPRRLSQPLVHLPQPPLLLLPVLPSHCLLQKVRQPHPLRSVLQQRYSWRVLLRLLLLVLLFYMPLPSLLPLLPLLHLFLLSLSLHDLSSQNSLPLQHSLRTPPSYYQQGSNSQTDSSRTPTPQARHGMSLSTPAA
jgi:hypothetical protein